MHTELYCPCLAGLDRVAAIRAIHQAWLQLTAITASVDVGCFDNAPAIAALRRCLEAVGHPAGLDHRAVDCRVSSSS